MTYAIISDIHANAIALSAVLEDAQRCGARRVICLGDVVGYGPEPEKAAATVRSAAAVCMAGNHDDAVSGRLDPRNFINLAADAAARHREALSQSNLEWLRGLPYVFEGGGRFACAHGDFTSPESFEYVMDEKDAKENFSARAEQLLFVGHSHVPGIFVTGASGKVYSLPPSDFTLEDGKRYIVNPGSVGYPRTVGNTCESTYVLYDDEELTITFRRLPFSVRSVMQTGRNPKRIKWRTVAAIAATTAAAAGALAWFFAPEERVETVTKVVTNSVTTVIEKSAPPMRADRQAECGIPHEAKTVALNVQLAKGSPPIQLQLIFQNAEGKTLADERWIVKRSKQKSMRIPAASVKAILSAMRVSGDKPATFTKFSISPVP